MSGAIVRWDVLVHVPLVIREYGWTVLWRALFCDYPTFLAVVWSVQ